MDFETFVSQVWHCIANGDNAYFVLYAVATCLLTQLVKKLFVNKVKVDVLHKFDFAVIIPFVFGLIFSVLDVYVVDAVREFSLAIVLRIALSCLAIGALASTIFKFVKSVNGQSLASLMKDDVFGIFYTQLLYFGNVRQMLMSNKLTLQDFIEQVKLIAAKAKTIYDSDDSVDTKRCQLAKLLGGIIDESSIETCINPISEALVNYAVSK